MRLLADRGHGNLVLEEYHDSNVPPYAILSHTWGDESQEYIFKDLIEGTGKDKLGYKKIAFCRKQAAADGLRYFWVDTCCIDKSSSAELSEAINSMFRWYANADVCYVLLTDVSVWKALVAQIPESRWFTRGWTLQELLAPASVIFFSKDGERLGNKRSLEQQIHQITGIPFKALRGESLTSFGVEERLSWAKGRQTKRQEDRAYSLFGLFDIQLPLLYGEGAEKAFTRLRKEINAGGQHRIEDASVLESPAQAQTWQPRWYFMYGSYTNPQALARALGLTVPPIVYRAFIKGHSVANLGTWKALLHAPVWCEAKGVAYKVEHEWQESIFMLRVSEEYVLEPCDIHMITGDGWREVEGRTFKYYGSADGLSNVVPQSTPFTHEDRG